MTRTGTSASDGRPLEVFRVEGTLPRSEGEPAVFRITVSPSIVASRVGEPEYVFHHSAGGVYRRLHSDPILVEHFARDLARLLRDRMDGSAIVQATTSRRVLADDAGVTRAGSVFPGALNGWVGDSEGVYAPKDVAAALKTLKAHLRRPRRTR